MGDTLNATMNYLLVILIFTHGWIYFARSENNVGCMFSPTVCGVNEQCFDDNVFGRCQVAYGTDVDLYRHALNVDSIQLLENELARLFAGGYRWNHDYTQCVIQNILYSSRHQISYDPGLCSRVMQFTIPEVPPEVLSELESPDPDELAFIKFKPNREDPEGDLYADEIFTPPIFSERSKDNDKRSPIRMPSNHVVFNHPEEETPVEEEKTVTDKETLIQELYKAAHDTQKLLEGLEGSSADRYPDDNTPIIKTERSSDLEQAPVFTEGGTEWHPVDEDDLLEPFDKKRVKQLTTTSNDDGPPRRHDNNDPPRRYDNDIVRLYNQPQPHRNQPPQLLTREMDEEEEDEPPTFGRSAADEGTFRWNAKHRNRMQDDDLMRFANENHRSSSGGDVVEIDRQVPDEDDSNLSDVIENDYLEDQLYAILPMEKDLSTFTSDKRYDTKKPGPTYMIHEDEDGDSSQDDVPMAMLGVDNLIQRLSKDAWSNQNQLHTLFDAPVGPSKPLSPFLRSFEATDEISRIYVASEDEDPPFVVPKENSKEDEKENKEPSPKTFERLSADQPEIIEGVDVDKIKTHEDKIANAAKTGEGHMGRYDSVDATHANLAIKEKELNEDNAQQLVKTFEKYLNLDRGSFSNIKVKGQEISFKVNPNSKGYNASGVVIKAEELAPQLKEKTGLTVEGAVIGDKVRSEVLRPDHDRRLVVLVFALCGAVSGLLLVAVAAYLVRRHARSREKLHNIAQPDTEASQDYQDLCRQRMASKANEKPEHVVNSPKKIRSLSQEGQVSSSSHSSTSSWNEEPVTSNMDISTGHMILSYMEDHLKNKDRLDREWEALCAYEAELCASTAANQPLNVKKNRYTDILPYDHSRVVLNELSNISGSDYINASSITDHDPRNPAYIATQGPLPQTAADFWQMIWEQGSVVVVMLSRLMENGVAMCHRYWPEEGSEVYHIYEVHLVSEHIWCDDYLVRSFYLKNLRTSETRTVTQFHFMSWPDNGVPNSTKALLEFRRKVNKSYRGRSCPVVVHCSDGIGRTGTYCLIDMVLNRMAKGAKEIDIAATLEHVRDQRTGMVKTKAQFEFVLMAIAEEVHAILKALSQ